MPIYELLWAQLSFSRKTEIPTDNVDAQTDLNHRCTHIPSCSINAGYMLINLIKATHWDEQTGSQSNLVLLCPLVCIA